MSYTAQVVCDPPTKWLWLWLLGAVCACTSCEPTDETGTPAEQWERARQMWSRREAGAFRAWKAVDPESPEGAEAAESLARADERYREGIRLFGEDDTEGSRAALSAGAAIAPIDPALYLPLAEVYRDRGLDESAAKYYRKLIAALPGSPLAERAGAELAKLSPGLGEVFDPPASDPGAESGAGPSLGPLPLALIAVGAALGIAALLFLFRHRLARGTSLDRLIAQNPELHSAIAYLIGSLRHELLKHRVGAVSDVLTGLGSQRVSFDQLAFLSDRLYGGVPLRDAWRAHLSAFSRALGHRLNLHRDRAFRDADRAIETIVALHPQLVGHAPRAIARLTGAHDQLKGFDRHLARLQSRLVRTRVDDVLLAQVLDEVRGEYAVSSVALEDLECEPVVEVAQIEVPRVDLVLILKNILRNAIMAVARDEGGRRVRMATRVDLEPTGEEVVRVSVRDSGSTSLTTEMIQGRDVGSGLGLVTTAIKRYGGAIEVRAASGGYAKEVTVIFFRVFEDEESDGEGR